MNNKYQMEIDEFKSHFRKFRGRKIVLYGIGRYTATLMEERSKELSDFHIVGLMDKDPDNIGKKVFGLPVIDGKTAEETADLVIINTSETYWSVIYNRIADLDLPIFYKNGERAGNSPCVCNSGTMKVPFGNREDLDLLMERAGVISFDFYDTLFMRALCNPGDVFRLMERILGDGWPAETGFMETRNRAVRESGQYYSLDELYERIEAISGLPHPVVNGIKEKELLLERKLLIPRTDVLNILKDAVGEGKEVYIISDMYLPSAFYMEVCKAYGINLPQSRLLLSNMLKRSKADGSLWDYYVREILRGRQGLHIGDHSIGDVEMPKAYGVQAVKIPGPWESMAGSSMNGLASHICSDYGSAIAGCILKRIFGNPFGVPIHNGKISINNNQDMGYVVLGPVMLNFLLWLDRKRREDGVERLVFMSRDGYLLKEDYEYFCSLNHQQPECCYLGISRQLAMSASITTNEELLEYARMPYTGGIGELFEDRFGIKGVKEIPNQTVECYLEAYHREIWQRLSDIRSSYLHYLEGKHLDDKSAVVDLGFYGNNQGYLNKLLDKKLSGYYFNANLSPHNGNARCQPMKACFQKEDDLTGEGSQVLKRMILIESVLTAPYGMVKAVDEKGCFICGEDKQNQVHFQAKKEINEGIKGFIKDYMEKFGIYNLRVDTEFTDWYYGYCLGGALDISDTVKQSFYNDNAMMNRLESMVFY